MDKIYLQPIDRALLHEYYKHFVMDADIFMDMSNFREYVYSPEKVDAYYDRLLSQNDRVDFLIMADGKTIAENEYALATTDDVYDWPKSDWTRTPILKHADHTAIGGQQPAKCKVKVKEAQGRQILLTVSNPSDQVAYLLRIVLKDKKGKIIDGVTFSDNYITIEPRGEKTVSCVLPRDVKFAADVLSY